jgi:hypothetical protein
VKEEEQTVETAPIGYDFESLRDLKGFQRWIADTYGYGFLYNEEKLTISVPKGTPFSQSQVNDLVDEFEEATYR